MKKALILTLALWTGMSNFAYASARIECADMMQKGVPQASSQEEVKSSHACCHKVPCQCEIKERSNDQSAPARISVNFSNEISVAPLDATTLTVLTAERFHNRSESPPDHPPLYALFSAYRI